MVEYKQPKTRIKVVEDGGEVGRSYFVDWEGVINENGCH